MSENLLRPVAGDRNPASPSKPWTRLVALTFAVIVVVLGCSTSEPNDATSATAEAAVDGTPDTATAGAEAGEQSPTTAPSPVPTAEPAGPIVERVETAQGTSLLDFQGNALVVHQWKPWPRVIGDADPFANARAHAFGMIGDSRSSGDILVAVDLEVCASGEQPVDLELFSPRFHLSNAEGDGAIDAAGDSLTAVIVDRVVEPAFVWPAAGSCHRGWQTLAWAGDLGDVAAVSYVAVSRAELTFGERHVYEWQLGDSSAGEADSATLRFPSGLKASFPSGELAGWAVTVLGWRPVGDTTELVTPSVSFDRPFLQPHPGYELIAALVEVCGGPAGHMPEFGLQVEDWNLFPRFTRGEPWGPGYVTVRPPLPGDCTTGWLPFEIPLGAEPSGLFATDTDDPDARLLTWAFDGEEVPAPSTGAAWPTQFLIDTVIEACGAIDALAIEFPETEPLELAITSSVAVQEADNRVAVYLSQTELFSDDVPEPRDEAGSVVQVVLNAFEESELALGDYEETSDSRLRTSGNILNPAGVDDVALPGITVTLTDITPSYICGVVSGGDNATVSGVFAAPLWEP